MIFERRLGNVMSEPDEDIGRIEIPAYWNPTPGEIDEVMQRGDGQAKGTLMANGDLILWPNNPDDPTSEHDSVTGQLGLNYGDVRFTFYLYRDALEYASAYTNPYTMENRKLLSDVGMVVRVSVSSSPRWGAFDHATDRWNPALIRRIAARLPGLAWIVLRQWLVDAATLDKTMVEPGDYVTSLEIMTAKIDKEQTS